ncbi:MAG: PFL family protein [Firmicutes bacterium]|nr:PFL family protein [Bacillota bacterium]
MPLSPKEIVETIRMVEFENLDIRTITLGISLRACTAPSAAQCATKVYDKICRTAERLVPVAQQIQEEYGIPIINKRVSVTPVAFLADSFTEAPDEVGLALDRAAKNIGIDFIGGYSALVAKGATLGDERLITSIPRVLSATDRVCSSVDLASTKAGINMDMVAQMGRIIKETAELTKERDGIGCAKLVVFANMPGDNPFMAGAVHGLEETENVINVGVSGPGVVLEAVRGLGPAPFGKLSEVIKRAAYKITRAGEFIGRRAAEELGVEFGILDLSLAPTPLVGDSVAEILEAMGLSRTGCAGTTAALALLNDAVKKGGAMASAYVGGLSGAFIPVSEDAGMIRAVECGSLTLNKLEAMTAVCSVGLDMIAIPGDTPAEVISGIIADEIAIGVMNNKTTAVRLIPAPGKKSGEWVEFGGLLGKAPVMEINTESPAAFIARGGRIPAPLQGLRN